MLLHDQVTITLTEKVDTLSGATPRVHTIDNVPCEITPLDSTKNVADQVLTTRYRFFSTFDLVTAIDQQLAEWPGNVGVTVTMNYKGKTLKTAAGIEVHRVLARFHHVEAILNDFYSVGA